MSTDITFRTAKLEAGKLVIDIPPDQLGPVMNFIRNMKSCLYQLEIKVFRKKRSLDVNAYAWVLIGKLSDALKIPPTIVYKNAIQNIGGNYEIIPVRDKAANKFSEIWQKQGLG